MSIKEILHSKKPISPLEIEKNSVATRKNKLENEKKPMFFLLGKKQKISIIKSLSEKGVISFNGNKSLAESISKQNNFKHINKNIDSNTVINFNNNTDNINNTINKTLSNQASQASRDFSSEKKRNPKVNFTTEPAIKIMNLDHLENANDNLGNPQYRKLLFNKLNSNICSLKELKINKTNELKAKRQIFKEEMRSSQKKMDKILKELHAVQVQNDDRKKKSASSLKFSLQEKERYQRIELEYQRNKKLEEAIDNEFKAQLNY